MHIWPRALAVLLGYAMAVTASIAATPSDLAKAPALQGVSPSDVAYLANLYNAALASHKTTITIYSANAPVDPNVNLGVAFRTFERTFPGLKIVSTRIGGPELSARLEGEFVSGRRQTDIISASDDYAARGLLESFDPPLTRNVPPILHYPGGYYVNAALKQFGLVYNTRLVKPDEVPHSIAEVLTEKWRGRVTVGQPSGSEPVDGAFAALLQTHAIDRATLARVAAFIPRRDRAPNASTSSSWVAQGRYAIALWAASSVGRQLASRGAPVAIATFKETVVTPTGHALLKGAPSPDASKLFLAWLFTPEAQRLYRDVIFEKPVLPGSATPPGLPDITERSTYQYPTLVGTPVIRKTYREVVAPIFGPAN